MEKDIINKNVIILGAARSGKSTLAKNIHRKYNYSIISIDSFVSALRDTFPELGISHSNTENKFRVLPTFVFSYMKKIIKEYPYEKFVLEGWHVYPEDIVKLFRNENVKIVCLGYTEITCEECLKLIRGNEIETSYTKKMTDKEVKELIFKHIEYSKMLKKQCEINNIKYYDTSLQRDKVLVEAMKY